MTYGNLKAYLLPSASDLLAATSAMLATAGLVAFVSL